MYKERIYRLEEEIYQIWSLIDDINDGINKTYYPKHEIENMCNKLNEYEQEIKYLKSEEKLHEEIDEEQNILMEINQTEYPKEDTKSFIRFEREYLKVEYEKVKKSLEEDYKLQNIVEKYIDNFDKFSIKDIAQNVRKDKDYKKLLNKSNLLPCIRFKKGNSNKQYSFSTNVKLKELFKVLCEDNDCYEKLSETKDLIKDHITSIENNNLLIDYCSYLEDVVNVLDELIEFENYKSNSNLLYNKLDIKFDSEKRQYSLKKNKIRRRKYISKIRDNKKELNRKKIKLLKEKGLTLSEISKNLNISKGYISDLVNKKK